MANTNGAESIGIGPKLGAANRATGQKQATLRIVESPGGPGQSARSSTSAMVMELFRIPR